MARFWWGFLLLGIILLIMSALSFLWERKIEGFMIGLGIVLLYYGFNLRTRQA
jgi:uncharacterized membrane protein